MCQHQGEERQDKSNSGCDKKQKMNTDATPARAKVKTESEGNEKKKGTNKQAETSSRSRETDGQRDRWSWVNPPTSPDTSESPGSSDVQLSPTFCWKVLCSWWSAEEG